MCIRDRIKTLTPDVKTVGALYSSSEDNSKSQVEEFKAYAEKALSLIHILSVATLAACSNSSQGADLISMKGDVITEHQFYEEVKNNPTAQQILLNMTIQKVFEKQFVHQAHNQLLGLNHESGLHHYHSLKYYIPMNNQVFLVLISNQLHQLYAEGYQPILHSL